jgi:hypothetical protein
MRRSMTNPASLALAFAALIATAPASFAQIVPYKGSGTGIYFPTKGDYGGSGVATHLGSLTFAGHLVITGADGLVFDFETTVPQVNKASNGDELRFTLSGQVELTPLDDTFTTFIAIWSAKGVVVGGTGRFAHAGPAHQPLDIVAINSPFTFADPFWSFSWQVDGKISLH